MKERVPRNDLCFCGSGKKYKKCHLDEDIAFTEKLAEFKKQGYPIPSWKIIKTPSEIDGIRKSGVLTHKILDLVTAIIKPGITTEAINAFVHQYTIDNHAIPAPLNYRGYPKSTCVSLNDVICHGIPNTKTILKDGDILNIDVTCILNGFYSDANRMYTVGKISPIAAKLVQVTKECLDLGIAAVQPFMPVNVIGEAIETHATANGFSVVRDYGGHGVGKEFHEDPFIFHYKRNHKDMIMVPNMVFTIEPMINEGSYKTHLLDDDWTAVTVDHKLSAQWEHTLAVTETGVEILT